MIFAGIAVTVGVSMYVLSISRLSEVDMVMLTKTHLFKKKNTLFKFFFFFIKRNQFFFVVDFQSNLIQP